MLVPESSPRPADEADVAEDDAALVLAAAAAAAAAILLRVTRRGVVCLGLGLSAADVLEAGRWLPEVGTLSPPPDSGDRFPRPPCALEDDEEEDDGVGRRLRLGPEMGLLEAGSLAECSSPSGLFPAALLPLWPSRSESDREQTSMSVAMGPVLGGRGWAAKAGGIGRGAFPAAAWLVLTSDSDPDVTDMSSALVCASLRLELVESEEDGRGGEGAVRSDGPSWTGLCSEGWARRSPHACCPRTSTRRPQGDQAPP